MKPMTEAERIKFNSESKLLYIGKAGQGMGMPDYDFVGSPETGMGIHIQVQQAQTEIIESIHEDKNLLRRKIKLNFLILLLLPFAFLHTMLFSCLYVFMFYKQGHHLPVSTTIILYICTGAVYLLVIPVYKSVKNALKKRLDLKIESEAKGGN